MLNWISRLLGFPRPEPRPQWEKEERSTTPPLGSRPTAPTLAEIFVNLAHLAGPRRATDNQRDALARLGLGTPPEQMSFEQASALLSTRAYIEGVIHQVGEPLLGDDRRSTEAHLISFVTNDPRLLKRVIEWSARSFSRGGSADVANPRRDEHWKLIAAEAKRLRQ